MPRIDCFVKMFLNSINDNRLNHKKVQLLRPRSAGLKDFTVYTTSSPMSRVLQKVAAARMEKRKVLSVWTSNSRNNNSKGKGGRRKTNNHKGCGGNEYGAEIVTEHYFSPVLDVNVLQGMKIYRFVNVVG